MEMYNFDERISDIEQTLTDLNSLKQNGNGWITISQSLIETIEDSLVIAIYSLSEQMLKNTVYKILEVCFDEVLQKPKDIYILKQMPPKTHPMTPNIKRIESELKPYKMGKLYLPKSSKSYKDAYNKLIEARHDYAHANNHTDQVNFKDAIEFVKYLRAFYHDHKKIEFISKLLDVVEDFKNLNFKNIEDYSTFSRRPFPDNEVMNDLNCLFNEGIQEVRVKEEIIEVNIYDIEFLNDIYDNVKKIFDTVDVIDEDNFLEKITIINQIMDELS